MILKGLFQIEKTHLKLYRNKMTAIPQDPSGYSKWPLSSWSFKKTVLATTIPIWNCIRAFSVTSGCVPASPIVGKELVVMDYTEFKP